MAMATMMLVWVLACLSEVPRGESGHAVAGHVRLRWLDQDRWPHRGAPPSACDGDKGIGSTRQWQGREEDTHWWPWSLVIPLGLARLRGRFGDAAGGENNTRPRGLRFTWRANVVRGARQPTRRVHNSFDAAIAARFPIDRPHGEVIVSIINGTATRVMLDGTIIGRRRLASANEHTKDRCTQHAQAAESSGGSSSATCQHHPGRVRPQTKHPRQMGLHEPEHDDGRGVYNWLLNSDDGAHDRNVAYRGSVHLLDLRGGGLANVAARTGNPADDEADEPSLRAGSKEHGSSSTRRCSMCPRTIELEDVDWAWCLCGNVIGEECKHLRCVRCGIEGLTDNTTKDDDAHGRREDERTTGHTDCKADCTSRIISISEALGFIAAG